MTAASNRPDEEIFGPLLQVIRVPDFDAARKSVRAAGHSGEVNLIFSVIKRADVGQYMAMVESHHPDAFSSIEEVRSIRRGVYRGRKPPLGFGGRGTFLLWKR
mgnify:CR=1 FL=1